ncbi:MAG: alpha/beta fold hydrolase [Undibacterium sp.]|uniref:alpha/beta hydrolase n=1 Tax=Undibacterium sp. TaxID=1914977 RepID=UPI00271DB223|nr:alpha/beta fold hydrolase [Undibacterium sp.]MDO8650650.1 alpha/beta fold hydrolase [Undibacterium sp.]
MLVASASLWLSLGAVGAMLGLRHLLHQGLAPESTVAGSNPADHGLSAQAVQIPGAQGLNLFAWFLPALDPGPRPAVVLLHGWGGNASTLLLAAQELHRSGYAVLLLESRNHGRSDRDDHSSLPRFAEDLDSALDWLSGQACIDAGCLMAMGHSVGGAAVLLSASRRHDLRAVISVSAFAHPEQVMRRWLALRHVPYLPLGWLVNRYVERVIGARFDDIAPSTILTRVNCPVLLLHGRQDSMVPIDDARKLWQYRGKAPVTLIECDGTHEGFDDLEDVSRRILAFLLAAIYTESTQTLPPPPENP